MDMKVNGVQLPDNKTGFTMDELKSMSKQQLLTIFDTNNSGNISDEELNAKGLDGKELSEMKAHVSSIKLYANETEIGKVTFNKNEVLNASTRKDYKAYGQPTIHIVETTFGTFEFRDDESCHQEGKTSILGGKVTNALLWSYKGTNKADTLSLKDSYIGVAEIGDGEADVIYLDEKSTFGLFGDYKHLKVDHYKDKIIREKSN